MSGRTVLGCCDVAKLTGRSRFAVWLWCTQGLEGGVRLPSVKVSGRLVIRVDDLRRFLKRANRDEFAALAVA